MAKERKSGDTESHFNLIFVQEPWGQNGSGSIKTHLATLKVKC